MAERVLIVDDEVDVAFAIELALQAEGFDVLVANDGETGLRLARDSMPDVVILDLMMPGIDGIEVCRRLRADPALGAVSIIMLTAMGMADDKVRGLSSGADDYVVKPFDPDELVARVRSEIRRSQQLRSVSPLTGLPGNHDIVRQLQRLIDEGAEFALIYADLDSFKPYNDRYGFARGDGVIRATADILADAVAAVDGQPAFLGHVGGDDFVLITGADKAEEIARRVIKDFDAMSPGLYDPADRDAGHLDVVDRLGASHEVPLLSISLGIATTATRRFASAAEASAAASEVKAHAKATPGSSWSIDQRRA